MMKIILASAAIAALFATGRVSAQVPAQDPAAVAPAMDPAATAADEKAAAELKEHHRHHHQGGITQFIAMSLDTLGADEAKRPQIEKLQHDLHRCLAPAGKTERRVLSTIADGVAAGAVDAKKVDAAIDRLGKASADTQPCSVKALNELHALLSPAERQALADKVQAHWQVWRQVNYEAAAGGREKGGGLAELTRELSLTSDQVEKVSDGLRSALPPSTAKFDPKKGEAHLQAFASAFSAEDFDAAAITANANGHLATNGAKRMAAFYETVTPLLTAEQRATLAGHLREHSGQQPSGI
jgi:Spy/CpxP family protein refolding chaperone